MRWMTLLFVLVLSCGGATEEDAPLCEANGDGCRCTPDAAGDVDVCSEASVDGLCCEIGTDLCVCTALTCGLHSSGFCGCGPRDVVLDDETTEVASCPSGGEIHCCLSTGAIIGAACFCGSECGPSEIEVASCTAELAMDCGSSERVAACGE